MKNKEKKESHKQPSYQLVLVKGNNSSVRKNGHAIVDTPHPTMLIKPEPIVITGKSPNFISLAQSLFCA